MKPKNIYGRMGAVFINTTLKYRLFMPALKLVHMFIKKHIPKKISNKWYNRNFIVFDRAFNKAQKHWYQDFLCNVYTHKKRGDHKHYIKNGHSCKALAMLRDTLVCMCINDTAYREFFNILMHEIANEMHKEYKEEMVNHLFYTSKNAYSVTYFSLGEYLNKSKNPIKIVSRRKVGK